jgi:hypothetical protein
MGFRPRETVRKVKIIHQKFINEEELLEIQASQGRLAYTIILMPT